LDSAGDFSQYRLLVLPDHIQVSPMLDRKLREYLAGGGSIVASYASGMDDRQNAFTTDLFGVTQINEGPRDLNGRLVRGKAYERHDYCEYILPRGRIGRGLAETEHAMYRKGISISALPGSETLAPVIGSWFDRTYRHFCSHRQTPSSGLETQPGIVRNGRCIYFSSPIFSQYDDNAPRWCKLLVLNAIDMLLPDPFIKHDGPSTLQVTLTEQSNHDRWIVHLLHFIPERRSKELDVIEDVIPLSNLKVFVRPPRPVQSAAIVPNSTRLTVSSEDPYVSFVVPRVDGHAMVSLTF
jgi:hypothetical protein